MTEDLPLRIGKEKPVVSRELDALSTPKDDTEARYIMLCLADQIKSENKLYAELMWGLYWCHRKKGKNVLDAWIAALETALGKKP